MFESVSVGSNESFEDSSKTLYRFLDDGKENVESSCDEREPEEYVTPRKEKKLK